MSAVRIDGAAFCDERYEDLAALAGLADADHARGKMARLWRQCTIEGTHILENQMVLRVLGDNGIQALIGSRLGEPAGPHSVRIRGTKGRIEWLSHLRENGKKGGRPKTLDTKPSGFQDNKPSGFQNRNPLTLTLTPVLTPTFSDPPISPPRAKKPKPKPETPTPAELASVHVVLGKLGKANGVNYSGAKEHVALIVARMRDGLSEMDLRKIVGYCSDKWRSKEDMREYLRPETLFGPKTHSRYLDAARTYYADVPDELHEAAS